MARFNKVKGPPSKTLNRTEKRKAERKLKKARKVAFSQRKFVSLIFINFEDL